MLNKRQEIPSGLFHNMGFGKGGVATFFSFTIQHISIGWTRKFPETNHQVRRSE
jgi:hypothetical protein